jgi:O-antigen/teichoic acid export membrane protein
VWTGSSLVFAAELLLVPTGLITAGFLTRQLGAEGYGLFTLLATVVGWLQWVTNSMLARAAHRQVAGATEWRPVAAEVVRLHLQAGGLVGAALFVCASPLAHVLQQPSVTGLLRLLALDVLVFALAAAYRNVLIGRNEYGTWAAATAARWVMRLVAIVGFVSLGWTVTGAVLGIMVANVAELVVGRWRVGALVRASPHEAAGIRRALFTVVAPVALSAIGLRTFDRADLLLLSVMGTDAATLGLYGAAQNLTVIVSIVASSVSPAVLATVSRLRLQGDEAGALRVSVDALRLPFLALPFIALAAGSAPEILQTIYGTGFAAAAVPFSVLLLGSGVLLVVSVATVLLVAADRGWSVVAISTPMLAGLVLMAVVLIPHYGSTGAAVATLVAATGGAVASMMITTRVAALQYPVRSMLVGAVLAVVAYVVAREWPVNGAALTVAKLVLLSTALGALIVALGELRLSSVRALFGRIAK